MKKTDVEIKDRKEDVEFLRMALNICQVGVDYITTDLIVEVLKELEKLKGDFTLNDGVSIHYEWKEKWTKYFEKLNSNENEKINSNN